MFRPLACCLLLASAGWAQDLSESATRLQADVKFLASDDLEGRGIGTSGLEQAADYIAASFRAAGLNVTTAGGDPYQEFEVTDGAQLNAPNTLKFLGPDGTSQELVLNQDFQVCSFGAAGKFEAPLVFAGYGIEATDLEFDEYQQVDVMGKVVVIVRRNPLQGNSESAFNVAHGISRHAALTTKISRAFSRGAVAVLFVNDHYTTATEKADLLSQQALAEQQVLQAAEKLIIQGDAGEDVKTVQQELKDAVAHLTQVRGLIAAHVADPLMEFGYGGTRSGKSLPIYHISQAACDQLLRAAANTTLQAIETQIDATGAPASMPLGAWKAVGQTSLEVIKRPVKNVIGVLEGQGPLAQETIVIGAHFDHLGYGGDGSFLPNVHEIHNGADDNASGTAGLLELARHFSQQGRPARRLVFIAFTGEERGLLGSAEYVEHPLFPLEQTIAMLNLDMIGRLNSEAKLTIFGTGTSPVWEPLVDSTATTLGLETAKKPEGFGPSDHSSFYGKKIPVLHFFTGIHPDYHRPSDDWEQINVAGMEQIVALIESITTSLLNEKSRPAYIEIAGQASLERNGSRPYFGSIPDFNSEAAGYAISGVAPGSPADIAGLKGGDVIVKLGADKVGGLDDFDLALRNYKPGQQIAVTVLRAGTEIELKVTLGTPKG